MEEQEFPVEFEKSAGCSGRKAGGMVIQGREVSGLQEIPGNIFKTICQPLGEVPLRQGESALAAKEKEEAETIKKGQ